MSKPDSQTTKHLPELIGFNPKRIITYCGLDVDERNGPWTARRDESTCPECQEKFDAKAMTQTTELLDALVWYYVAKGWPCYTEKETHRWPGWTEEMQHEQSRALERHAARRDVIYDKAN